MSTRLSRLTVYLTVPFFCALLTGCGRGLPPTAPVQGRVTWNGKPVESGTITFYPENGRPATGRIQRDGSYTLTTFKTGDGATLGKHRVTIEATTATSTESAPKSFDEEAKRALSGAGRPGKATVQWLVPQEYSRRETSPLTAEVKPGGNKIDFLLPTAGL